MAQKYTQEDSLYHSAYAYGWRHNWPDPIRTKFPDSWNKMKIRVYTNLYKQFKGKKRKDNKKDEK